MTDTTFSIGDLLSFEVVAHVTKPTFVFPEDGSPMFIKCDGPIEILPEVQRTRRRSQTTDQSMPDPKYMDVTNLATGEVGRVLVHSMIESTLTDSYPVVGTGDDAKPGYIGRIFRIRKLGKIKGQRGFTYNSFEIIEVKLNKKAEPIASADAGKKAAK